MTAPRVQPAWPGLVAGAFGTAWVVLGLGGADLLDPRRIDWLLAGDPAWHLVGWLFFRQSDWSWPLGAIPDLAAPLGTTVAYTDSIPWLAVATKLASPLLPEPFTYAGPWLLACFALQGVSGVRLLRTAGLDPWPAALGGCLFATAPVLGFRIQHQALCGHFLLLAALELGFRAPASAPERRRVVTAAFLYTGFAAGIHPYLAAMVGGLASAAIVRLWLGFGLAPARAAGSCLALAFGALGLFWSFGYLGTGTDTGAAGFGLYSSDLLALFDPHDRSRVLPAIGSAGARYEGYGYLGAGVLLLAAVAAAGVLAGRVRLAPGVLRRAAPLLLVVLACSVLAWSGRVTLAGRAVVDYSPWTAPLLPVLEAVRVSGRFVWPLHYVAATLSCVGAARALREHPRALAALLAGALALQSFEQVGVPVWDRFPARPPPTFSATWELAREAYVSVSLYPPVISAPGTDACGARNVDPGTLTAPSLLAHALRKPFNSAYLARVDAERARAACQVTLDEVHGGRLDPRKLYVIAPEQLAAFRAGAPAARCGLLDGFWACVAGENDDPFAAALVPVPAPGAGAQGAAALAALLLVGAFRRRAAQDPAQSARGPGQRWRRARLRRTTRARARGSPPAQGSARL